MKFAMNGASSPGVCLLTITKFSLVGAYTLMAMCYDTLVYAIWRLYKQPTAI
jgi:hypothetical protein